ncbi:MAG TPA: hypothetical protein VIH05_04405 [Tepidiformaceae bacterium]
MRPDVPRVIGGISAAIMTQILPELRTPIAIQNTTLAVGLMVMISQEFDRAAARLVEENRALRELLTDAQGILDDEPLAIRIQEAVGTGEDPDLHIPALQASNDRLRAMLIDVQARAEAADGREFDNLDERIWAELQESTRRRHLSSPLA